MKTSKYLTCFLALLFCIGCQCQIPSDDVMNPVGNDVSSDVATGDDFLGDVSDDLYSDLGGDVSNDVNNPVGVQTGDALDKMGGFDRGDFQNGFMDVEYSENYGGMVYGEEDYSNRDHNYDRRALKPMEISLAIIYAIITCVGLIANGVVFFVIFAGREIGKTVTAMYVVQLAIADSALLLTLPIFGLQKVSMNWSFGAVTCTLCHSIKFLSYYAGIFFLTAMSVDRYVAVAYSTKSHQLSLHQLRTRKRTMIVCAVVWFAAGCMTLPILMYARTEEVVDRTICRLMFPGYVKFNASETYIFVASDYDMDPVEVTTAVDDQLFDEPVTEQTEEVTTNSPSFQDSDYNSMSNAFGFDNKSFPFLNQTEYTCSHKHQTEVYETWLVVDFIVGFVLPFIVITISYVMIVRRLQTSEDKVANMTGKRTISMRKRVTRMVAVLVICFVVCWLPNHLFTLAKIRGLDLSVTPCYGIEHFLVAFSFSNAAINPILYSFLSHNFSTRFRDSLAMARRRMGRRGSMATALQHNPGTNSPEHPNFTKRLSNFMGVRKLSRGGSADGGEYYVRSGNGQTETNKKPKYAFPLRDLSRKRVRIEPNVYSDTEQAKMENESRANQTECSRVLLESRKETNEV